MTTGRQQRKHDWLLRPCSNVHTSSQSAHIKPIRWC